MPDRNRICSATREGVFGVASERDGGGRLVWMVHSAALTQKTCQNPTATDVVCATNAAGPVLIGLVHPKS